MIERGVRHVQCFLAGWDHHRNLTTQFEIQCRDTDQPSTMPVKDLKRRGLLDDTLVIWGGKLSRPAEKSRQFQNTAGESRPVTP